VDDDRMTLMLVRLILERAEFCTHFLTAENGSLAIQLYDQQFLLPNTEQQLLDVILLDLNMPVLNGWEFLTAFAEKYPEQALKTSIFILSSSVDPFEKETAAEHPLVAAFLAKPLSFDALEKLKRHPALAQFFPEK